VSIGSTLYYLGETFIKCSISLFHLSIQEYFENFVEGTVNILCSAKYVLMMPSIIFLGLFAPQALYSQLDYVSCENDRDSEADVEADLQNARGSNEESCGLGQVLMFPHCLTAEILSELFR
jgi:hypothetical protein